MEFRSVADLNRDILRSLDRLPRDLDVVVGVPRSGLLAATLVALALNRPLADVEGFLDGRILSSGRTRRHARMGHEHADMRSVLVVDDSIRTGKAMREAREKLEAAFPDKTFTFCAVYGTDNERAATDLVFDIVPEPRMFEWNAMHHSFLARACVDIDGVLCFDPTSEENDDGEAYLGFLHNARPLHTPTRRIGELVTSRLERYRGETEAWLAQQGVEYDRLVMLDLPDAETRRRLGAHASFKGEHYKASKAIIFIESELKQAQQIAQISGKPVLWIGGPEMIQPGLTSAAGVVHNLKRSQGLKRSVRSLLGATTYNRVKSVLRPGQRTS